MSRRGRLRWSWLGLVAALLVVGFSQIVAIYVVQGFRQGLDADMELILQAASVGDLVQGALSVGGAGLVFVVLAIWLANWTKSPRIAFPVIAAGVPTVLYLVLQGPYGSHNLSYLPTWLMPAFVAAGFACAAFVYERVAASVESK